jgi:hypothetical protein
MRAALGFAGPSLLAFVDREMRAQYERFFAKAVGPAGR